LKCHESEILNKVAYAVDNSEKWRAFLCDLFKKQNKQKDFKIYTHFEVIHCVNMWLYLAYALRN